MICVRAGWGHAVTDVIIRVAVVDLVAGVTIHEVAVRAIRVATSRTAGTTVGAARPVDADVRAVRAAIGMIHAAVVADRHVADGPVAARAATGTIRAAVVVAPAILAPHVGHRAAASGVMKTSARVGVRA